MKRGMRFLEYLIPVIGFAMFAAGVAWAGGGEEKFSPSSEINSPLLKDAVEEYLHGIVEEPVRKWEVIEIKTPRDERLPKDADDFKVTSHRAYSRGKRFVFYVDFYKNGKVISRLNVPAEVEITADVVVATRHIRRGDVISGGDVEVVSRAVSPNERGLCTDVAQVKGQVAERNIRAGHPVLETEVKRPPDIRNGDFVMIVAENQNVKVTAKGLAKQDGSLGETIPVINLRSNAKVFARIVGQSLVQVEF